MTDVRLKCQSAGRPGVILGGPYSLISESTGVEFHLCICLQNFAIFNLLQHVTA